jgi:uncharacterized membrane protein
MSRSRDEWPEVNHRTETLTLADGIFAFSITLLAIDIRAPDIPANLLATDLPLALVGLIPRINSFIITFWIVGSYWIGYRRIFSYIVRHDRGLIYLNLLFLMFIVLLPFPADLIGRYSTELISLVIGSVLFASTGISLGLIWRHATKDHRLVDRRLDQRVIGLITLRTLVSPVVFIASIPFFYITTFLDSSISPFRQFFYLIVVPLFSIIDRRYK